MSAASAQIVAKAWNFAHVLRDDGLSFMRLANPYSAESVK